MNSHTVEGGQECTVESCKEKQRDLGQLLHLGMEGVVVSSSLQEEGRYLFLVYGTKCVSNHLETVN